MARLSSRNGLQAEGTQGVEDPRLCLMICHCSTHQRSPREKGTLRDEEKALILTQKKGRRNQNIKINTLRVSTALLTEKKSQLLAGSLKFKVIMDFQQDRCEKK